MQSGIKASAELKEAFTTLLSTPSQFALLVTIEAETLVPTSTIPASSPFPSTLSQLAPHLAPTSAVYILFRPSPGPSIVAATYVPDTAPVRSKMLFASSRLSLVRELGSEHFAETLFATTPAELTPEGWARHEAHRGLDAPLTREEQGARDLDVEGAVGTGRRVETGGGGKLGLKVGEGVVQALRGCGEGRAVQIGIDTASETFVLVAERDVPASALKGEISATEPRYTFYGYRPAGAEVQTLFIYTCPSGSKIKERMMYAAGRAGVVSLAETQAGLVLAKKLEGAGPDDFDEDALKAEFVTPADKVETKGFARPKRPGRR